MRNYVHFVIGLDYDPNLAGAPPNVMGIFQNDDDAEGFQGQQYDVWIKLNKNLLAGWLAEVDPFVMQTIIDFAQTQPDVNQGTSLAFASPRKWWSNDK